MSRKSRNRHSRRSRRAAGQSHSNSGETSNPNLLATPVGDTPAENKPVEDTPVVDAPIDPQVVRPDVHRQDEPAIPPEYARVLLAEFQSLKSLIQDSIRPVDDAPPAEAPPAEAPPAEASWATDEFAEEHEELLRRVQQLTADNEEFSEENRELQRELAEARAAGSTVSTTANITGRDAADLLTWDQRKELIYRQMEDDSFDAESFLSTLSTKMPDVMEETGSDEQADPARLAAQVFDRLESLSGEVLRRDAEVAELRALLEQREHAGEGVAVGAAAIAQMLDGDDLIRQERERLQQMQIDWEEKFRQAEIEASLERAKLSRERQDQQRRIAELEESLEHARRENAVAAGGDGRKRRWLAELGL